MSDLFSYFGIDDTTAPIKPASIPASEGGTAPTAPATHALDGCNVTVPESNKVVYLASDRLRGNKSPSNQQQDDCDTQEGSTNDQTNEDDDLLIDEPDVDESKAELAELGGNSANTEIIKADSKQTLAEGSAELKKEEKKPVFNNVTYICYAGLRFPITKFFDQDILATLDLEKVRKRLEKDFSELSKQRTKMEWDETKNIICPMVTGGKKGASFSQGLKGFFFRSKDLFEKKEPINILAARDGYYEVRENVIGVFIAKAPVVEELESCHDGFKMKLPKIPEYLFAQLVSFFSDYAMYEVEVMGVFYWDTEDERYFLDVPIQNVTKDSIDSHYSEVPMHYIKVAEIHSHNTMDAYFSSVDNEDELGTMLFGVVGRLQQGICHITYDICTRAGVSGRFIPIKPNVIIEGNYPEDKIKVLDPISYPEGWKKRVHMKLNQSNNGGN